MKSIYKILQKRFIRTPFVERLIYIMKILLQNFHKLNGNRVVGAQQKEKRRN